jgi:hypothetical protein
MTEAANKPKASDAIRELAEKHGQLTPEIVLEAAKPKTSPLHRFFQWDNTKAAAQYRLVQAACLIRRIKVTYQTADEKTVRVRAFVNVTPERRECADEDPDAGTRGIYVSTHDAMTSDHYRAQVLQQCKSDVETFRRKWTALNEASDIIAAMEKFTIEIQ